ncbi:MAG: CoA transferase [Ruminococcaceae bacterium]|nr:CoA transferase [Oscillospiraceae bacterium]
MSKPLEGIKVVDLTTFVAAPVTARLLGDLGAEVIKIEHPKGDGWREFGINFNTRFNDDENPVFDIYNSGKKMISVNLKSTEGKEILWKLLDDADVFVTNTRPDALKRLGLAYEDIKERYPRLIYAIVLGYGEEGPDAAKPAFDTTAFWARTGFARDMSPLTDSYIPITSPSGVGDTVTGYNLTAQICAALLGRARSGKGECVKAGLYHTGIFTMGTMEIIAQKPWGREFPRSRMQVEPPGGCYETKDGDWFYLATGQVSVALPKIFNMIGRPDLVDDERYNTREARVKNGVELYKFFAEVYKTKTMAEWAELAKEFDLPLIRMNHFSDVTTDEQAWANGYLEYMTCPNGETVTMPSPPIEMETVGKIETKPAAKVGADTKEVLLGLGYTPEEISAMEETGAIYTGK